MLQPDPTLAFKTREKQREKLQEMEGKKKIKPVKHGKSKTVENMD